MLLCEQPDIKICLGTLAEKSPTFDRDQTFPCCQDFIMI